MLSEQLNPPVKVGDIFDARCEGLGTQGDGVFKVNKFVVFARGASVDEYYKIKIVKVLPKVAFAEIIE